MGEILDLQVHVYVPKIMTEDTRALIVAEGALIIITNGDYDAAVKEAEQASLHASGLLIQDTAWSGYEEVPQVSQRANTLASAVSNDVVSSGLLMATLQ